MVSAVSVLLAFAGFAFGLALSVRAFRHAPEGELPTLLAGGSFGLFLDGGPSKLCWSEELGRSVAYRWPSCIGRMSG